MKIPRKGKKEAIFELFPEKSKLAREKNMIMFVS
jgi:hypothetical protein